MTPNAWKVLEMLAGGADRFYGEVWYFPFKPISEQTGLDRPTARRVTRRLKRKGYAEFKKGLWNEDGEPAGAGYGITPAGLTALMERAREMGVG